jgi:hypothetical protein
MIPVPGMTGDLAAMALYACQSVGLVREEASAGEIVTEIASQAQHALASLTEGKGSRGVSVRRERTGAKSSQ